MKAVDALTTLRLANLWSFNWVHMAMTFALCADAVRIVIAIFTFIAVLACVTIFTLVTCRLQLSRFNGAIACRSHCGTRAAMALFCGIRTRIKSFFAFFTVFPFTIFLAV